MIYKKLTDYKEDILSEVKTTWRDILPEIVPHIFWYKVYDEEIKESWYEIMIETSVDYDLYTEALRRVDDSLHE